jgi:tRNA nucleotidyltransferase/poly(A) polymerase
MRDLSKLVSNESTLRSITDLLTPKTYLVGGCIRDMLLGHRQQDFDIVTFCDVRHMAEALGERLSSSAFWMDKKRGVLRITLKKSGITIDISSPKGRDICEDLTQRDITINAMGFDMETGELIDPLHGMDDLEQGIIRIISEENLRDDPARVIRCLRFSVMLGFTIANATLALLKTYAPQLREVSPERIKQEFLKALSYLHGSRFFSLMETASLIDILFSSEPSQKEFFGIRPALRMAFEIDGLIYDSSTFLRGIGNTLDHEVESGLSRAGLLRLAVFLFGMYGFSECESWSKDLFSPGRHLSYAVHSARKFCSALRFSSQAHLLIQRIIACQELIHDMFCEEGLNPRELHHLCVAAYPCLPEALLLAVACKAGQKNDHALGLERARLKEPVSRVWRYHQEIYQEHIRTPLIDGNDVISQLGLEPGPEVGRFLRMIETARAEGIVHSRQEALDYLLTIKS